MWRLRGFIEIKGVWAIRFSRLFVGFRFIETWGGAFMFLSMKTLLIQYKYPPPYSY